MEPGGERTFHHVLRAAVQRSGLGLDRIRYRLEQQGHRLSVATLSLWQTGQRRPERRESLAALTALEEILAVPSGSLTSVLGPPRSRGPGPNGQRRVPVEAMWPADPQVPALLGDVDAEDEFLVRLSHHDLVTLGPDGSERSLRVRLVLKATRSGVSRLPIAFASDHPDAPRPVVRPLRHCSVRSAEYVPERGYLVASVEFDRVLARGEVIMVEYVVEHAPAPARSVRSERKLRFPVHEYFAEVSFHPDAVPARCGWTFYGDGTTTRGGELPIDSTHCVHFAASNAKPGRYSIHWEW
ncbi:XRE family transcriptional regulator [Actinokineospora fastidiosa]|uniref:Uncharacterized protein n=1 Tax=Actinokineospora fastidiosa TaxID=1816 RepID=A0A918LCN3_9PSEU|nr:XRE family transcriptional regulator [Actinokineospora fastidiosa]GGS29828.1 hypothetical protein GCM10010171_23980 [Actinokineospora fastidiosa]